MLASVPILDGFHLRNWTLLNYYVLDKKFPSELLIVYHLGPKTPSIQHVMNLINSLIELAEWLHGRNSWKSQKIGCSNEWFSSTKRKGKAELTHLAMNSFSWAAIYQRFSEGVLDPYGCRRFLIKPLYNTVASLPVAMISTFNCGINVQLNYPGETFRQFNRLMMAFYLHITHNQ